MRKQTKLVAVLTAAALLAMGASMTSFAKGWQKDDEGIWHYYDSDDDMVTGEWRKDNGRWFYLDDDGDMATNQWVDDEYYVGEDGHRLKNEWVKTWGDEDDEDDPDVDESWFYFDSKGKMVAATGSAEYKSKIIGGKTYYFDVDGKMQTGWLQTDDESLYYLGGEDEGWRTQNKWLWLEEPDSEEDGDSVTINGHDSTSNDDLCDEEGWYWFEQNGKANLKGTRKVNGKTYYFNAHGQMLYEWVNGKAASPNFVIDNDEATGATIGQMKYANTVEDGSRGNGWFLIDGSYGTSREAETKWYYFKDGKAKAATSGLKIEKLTWTVDGTKKTGKFCFNTNGEMQTGLKKVGTDMYYFDGEGYMQTGKVTITDDKNDTFDFYFETKSSNNGKGIDRVKDKTLYVEGQKITADDKYAVVWAHGQYYLVNKSGKLQKNTKKAYQLDTVNDLDDAYVKVNENGIVMGISNDKDTLGNNKAGIELYAYATGRYTGKTVGSGATKYTVYDEDDAIAKTAGTRALAGFKGYYQE